MKAVIQRVKEASVTIDGEIVASIGPGLCVLIGVQQDDAPDDAAYLARKITNLRIFSDQQGEFSLSVQQIGGTVLAISQFTLHADCRKGRRPSFSEAAAPEKARFLYDSFVDHLASLGLSVATGRFQSHMDVGLVNDGPVTIIIDSRIRESS